MRLMSEMWRNHIKSRSCLLEVWPRGHSDNLEVGIFDPLLSGLPWGILAIWKLGFVAPVYLDFHGAIIPIVI